MHAFPRRILTSMQVSLSISPSMPCALQEVAVTLVHNDVLRIRDLPDRLASFRATCPGCPRLKVVANIPYNITTGEGWVQGAAVENWHMGASGMTAMCWLQI